MSAVDSAFVPDDSSREPSNPMPRIDNSAMRQAAETTQMSATLKIGQCGSSRKSTTCPFANDGSRRNRSVRLPSAPPISRPRPSAHARLRSLRAEKMVNDGDNTYGGRVVTNPSGGLLSKGHPLGATGLAQCTELVQQLRGTAEARQVKGARTALQHNLGLGGACVVTMYQA